MKFVTSNCSIGYPVYGAKFLNNRMLLIAGGGGEGNNGIPNKLTVLRIDFAKKKVIKRFREITLDDDDDSPTTLDVANDTILLGCNENSEKIKKGEGNRHLRKFLFENEHLKFVAGIDFDRSKQPDDYTKLIYLSRDGSVGAVASSAIPTVIRIIDPKELTEKYEIETGHEVKDMHFAPDGKVISYITTSTLEVISIVTGRFIIRKTDFDPNYSLSKIKFLTDDVVLIAAALKKGNGIVMIRISLRSGSATVLKTKLITNKFKGVTAMDVDQKNELAVLAGSDNSLSIVKLRDLSLAKTFKQVHTFAITRVSFSPDSRLIASVSAASTVHVVKVPENFAHSTSIWSKLWKLLLNFVFVALVAFLAQITLKYNLHNRSYQFVKYWYEERRNRAIVKREDSEQITLVGAVSSEASSSVVPTYSISSGTVSSVAEPTATSLSSDLLNQEKTDVLISGSVTPKSNEAGKAMTTSSEQVAPTNKSSGVERSNPLEDTANTAGTSTFSSATHSEVPENEGSTATTSISIMVTDTAMGISEETAANSPSHHGPTPKPSDIAAEPVDQEIVSEVFTSGTSSKLAKPSTTASASATTAASTSSQPVDFETLEDSSVSPQGIYSSSTRPISSSIETTPSEIKRNEETSLSSTNTQEPTDSTSENGLTISSETSLASPSSSQASNLAATGINSTSQSEQIVKSNIDTSVSQTSSGSPSEGIHTTGISPDEVTLGIAIETPALNESSADLSKATGTVPSPEVSSSVLENSASRPNISEASSPESSSTASSNVSSDVPSSNVLSTTAKDVGGTSEAPITSMSEMLEAVSTTKTSSSLNSSDATSSVTAPSSTDSQESSSPTESTVTSSATAADISEPVGSNSTTASTGGLMTSISRAVNLASDTESSQKPSDSISLSSSTSRVQANTTPTSNQISDSSHSEEIVPEYGGHLQTGSKPLDTHRESSQDTSAAAEDIGLDASYVSSSQTIKETAASSKTLTSDVNEPTQVAQDGEEVTEDSDKTQHEDLVEEVELNE